MTTLQRKQKAMKLSISHALKQSKATHCIVQYNDPNQTKKVLNVDQIQNPAEKRLKIGDEWSLKGESGRHHSRVKILHLGSYEYTDALRSVVF